MRATNGITGLVIYDVRMYENGQQVRSILNVDTVSYNGSNKKKSMRNIILPKQ